ncbi:hypothetical protein [Anaerotignum propionicum]|uniref:hypothetical protein n=1 Tax=Anaerotignum propionicum TaxID=28446 RepID=UPI003B50CC5C
MVRIEIINKATIDSKREKPPLFKHFLILFILNSTLLGYIGGESHSISIIIHIKGIGSATTLYCYNSSSGSFSFFNLLQILTIFFIYFFSIQIDSC